ncbi:MAG: SUMF1/EgtB/PvdO family nonheme iron enzyme [Phycisphaeraceae bacterium]|nr:SUMF1/EgtB/PvdO family nonheme iron enzyme [Phycisphaeraceae bacterium]
MRKNNTPHGPTAVGLLAAWAAGVPALAQPAFFERSGIQFARIGDAGNVGYSGPDPTGRATGRGGVAHEYAIGRLEITTGQWLEFVNTYSTRGGAYSTFARPVFWGAVEDPAYAGPGVRWVLRSDIASPQLAPVAGINWRESAMFCNWLHNDKDPGEWAIMDGAYDTSTFTKNPNNTFNDQTTHHPDARFWIPTWDEWLKAVHWDPNRNAPGAGGYWLYAGSSDEAPIGGPPGVGQVNSAFHYPDFEEWDIPLGSYPEETSPWGLLDTAGATTEWTEEWLRPHRHDERIADGSWATDNVIEQLDPLAWYLSWSPESGYPYAGIRVASAVPAPAGLITAAGAVLCCLGRRSRKGVCE